MELRIYNSLSRKKEKFESITPGEVKLYLCGPTVYDLLHIGNYVGPIVFNMVRNWLEESGYKVNFVYNYTDVDDKIIKRANDEGVTSTEISEKYIAIFEEDFARLGLRKHTHNPRVTQHMPDIIKIIEKLLENKKAYVAEDGEVIYSIDSFENYGALSGKNLDELQAGSRVEVSHKKQNPLDFTLWKPAKPGEPSWESPWGKGRPGWHIECSAMSCAILGEQIDIHGGGKDLIFPHHENEIAQSEGACGKTFVRYWMHNNFLNFSNTKMSKSLGNVKYARDFINEYNPEILKFMVLGTHYRTENDFSKDKVTMSVASLARIYSSLKMANFLLDSSSDEVDDKLDPAFSAVLAKTQEGIKDALNDDFNTPEFFARVFELVRNFNSSYKMGQGIKPVHRAKAKAFKDIVATSGQLLSLFQEQPVEFLTVLDDMLLAEKDIKREYVDELVQKRASARAEKDFALSDKYRDELNDLGILVMDSPQGSIWEVNKGS